MAAPTAISKTSPRVDGWPRGLLVLGRLALGAIFVYAAFTKLYFNGGWHLDDYQFFFAMAINSYNMLPMWAVVGAAWVLPWLELGLGALLIIGAGLRWTGLIASGLLVVFIGVITRAMILGLEINCGCFGNNEKLGTVTLLRDTGLLLLALAVTTGAFLIKKREASVSS